MESDETFAKKIGDQFEQRTGEVDTQTRARLDVMRRQAVDMATEQQEHAVNRWPWLRRAGYAAAFSLVVTAGVIGLNTQPKMQIDQSSSLELVMLNEDFEIMDEDLAFYDWVESELGNRG